LIQIPHKLQNQVNIQIAFWEYFGFALWRIAAELDLDLKTLIFLGEKIAIF